MRSPQHSRELGLGMVYQHFTLVAQMTVAENLVLGRARSTCQHRLEVRTSGTAPIHERHAVSARSGASGRDPCRRRKQKLEILKQLYLGRRFLVLDEPTSVLTPGEADQVLSEMRRLADSNMLTVVLITHKFREVTAVRRRCLGDARRSPADD